ncbi:MAG TPA: Type 1 glutamine amidotransferase-like domain-containing protein [Patescibacteria group bacterium]|nr:Type 1 glutamine amidotransferase-like domain-containing protein [Patescibacteria group bacterium]
MKLYLSSYRVPTPEKLFGLLNKPPIDARVAIIPNAKDYKLPNERAQKLDELIYDLAKYGFSTEVVDLRDYEDEATLRPMLQGYDLLWAAGGNTFILRSEIRRSGLEALLPELLDAGMVYCGESAGAIVAGLTLEGAEVADESELADEVIEEGLGLVPRIIVPHADSSDFVEYINHIKKHFGDDPRLLYLRDNEALAIDTAQGETVEK